MAKGEKNKAENVTDSDSKKLSIHLSSENDASEGNNNFSIDDLPLMLATNFFTEYDDLMKHYNFEQQIELTDHLLLMIDEIEAFAHNPDKDIYKGFAIREDILLKKYRKSYTPYYEVGFFLYFNFESAIFDKEVIDKRYEPLVFQAQEIIDCVKTFVMYCHFFLHSRRQDRYTETEPDPNFEINSFNQQQPIIQRYFLDKKEIEDVFVQTNDKESTQARQLLAIYYLLKVGFNVVPRENNPVSDIARLAHLLTGTKLKPINQSELYKKLLKMPTFKKGIPLVKDLLFIRSYFEVAGLEKILQQVNADLKEAIDALTPYEREQFKDY